MRLKTFFLILALIAPSAFVSAAPENRLYQDVTRLLCFFIYNMMMDGNQQPEVNLNNDNDLINLRHELHQLMKRQRQLVSRVQPDVGSLQELAKKIKEIKERIRAILRQQPGFPGDRAYVETIRRRIQEREERAGIMGDIGDVLQLQIRSPQEYVGGGFLQNNFPNRPQVLWISHRVQTEEHLDAVQRDLMEERRRYNEWQDDSDLFS